MTAKIKGEFTQNETDFINAAMNVQSASEIAHFLDRIYKSIYRKINRLKKQNPS